MGFVPEDFTRLIYMINHLTTHHCRTVLFPGSNAIHSSARLLEMLPSKWEHLSFEIFDNIIEMRTHSEKAMMKDFSNPDCDVLIVDNSLKLVRFTPKEIQRYFLRLGDLEDKVDDCVTQERGRVWKAMLLTSQFAYWAKYQDPWFFLNTFRPDYNFSEE